MARVFFLTFAVFWWLIIPPPGSWLIVLVPWLGFEVRDKVRAFRARAERKNLSGSQGV